MKHPRKPTASSQQQPTANSQQPTANSRKKEYQMLLMDPKIISIDYPMMLW